MQMVGVMSKDDAVSLENSDWPVRNDAMRDSAENTQKGRQFVAVSHLPETKLRFYNRRGPNRLLKRCK